MQSLILPQADLQLETRRKNTLRARFSRSAPWAGAYRQEDDHDKAFPHAKRRHVGPCNTYNCHGLTFAARRTEIVFSEVTKILEEDDYVEIDAKDVLPGDIVVYFSTGLKGGVAGDAERSGIVLERTNLGNVKIVSKWRLGDERVHSVGDCLYDTGDVRYFKVNDCPRNKTGKPFRGGTRPRGREHTLIPPT